MRILHTLFSRGFTGMERHVTELCNYQSRNHQVALLVRYDESYSQDVSFLSWLSPEVKVLRMPRRLPAPWIRWHVFKWKPDIVHSHHKRDIKYVGRGVKSVPKVGTLHMWYHDEFGLFDGLICIAAWQREAIPAAFDGLVTEIANWLSPKAIPAPPGAASELRRKLGIPEDAYVVGSVGRFAPEKGFAELTEAFIKADLENAYLVIVGEGPERGRILGRHSNDRIIFPGATSDPFAYYDLFDVFVLSSKLEPFGLVLLEAMNARLPIISTTLGGPREILPAADVVWIEPDDVEGMAIALRDAYHSARRKPVAYDLSRFRIDVQADKVFAFYQQILSAWRLKRN